MAIEQGLTILAWYENLQKDEQPPEYLWEDPEGLEQWFKAVEEAREDGMATKRGLSDHDPDDQTPHMTGNEYARFFKD